MQVSVRDLMTSQPPTVDGLTTVEDATQVILERALSEIYVIDDEGRLLGTVSDYELLKFRILKNDAGKSVTCCMSRSMLVLSPEMSLNEVAGFFRQSCYARLAVVENGRVVGQLTRRDVLRALLVLDEINDQRARDGHAPLPDGPETADRKSTGRPVRTGDSGGHHRIETPQDARPRKPASMQLPVSPGSSAASQNRPATDC